MQSFLLPTHLPACRYSGMALPQPSQVEPLRRRFPRFSPQLMEVLEACLQVGYGSARIGADVVWGAPLS